MPTASDLKQMQALPLHLKIQKSKQRIREWYEHWDGNVYVSVSGGKDSQVLAHLVKQLYPDVPCVFCNTGLEYNGVRRKATELADETIFPQMNFEWVIKKYGYPVISKEVAECIHSARLGIKKGENNLRLRRLNGEVLNHDGGSSRYNRAKWKFLIDAPFEIGSLCCNSMKKRPAYRYTKRTGRYPYIGTTAQESNLRRTKWIREGCNAFDNVHPTSTPLAFWLEQDILQYIKDNDLELAAEYGEVEGEPGNLHTTGIERSGCTFCLFGIAQNPDRLLYLKEHDPPKYNYVMNGGHFNENGMWEPYHGLGYKFVIDWLNEHGDLDIKY